MKIITEEYISREPVKKFIEKIETTDGRTFYMSEKGYAETHQKKLDEIEASKKLINYKEVDLPYYRFRYERAIAFTFELTETLLTIEKKYDTFSRMKNLTGLY